jgi:type I restriction enzyme R subunit
MPNPQFNESTVEEAALSWFEELEYEVAHGPNIAPGESGAMRDSFNQVVLIGRLREAIDRLNPKIPHEAREEALRKVLRPDSPSLVGANRVFHRMLRDGVEVEYRRKDGSIAGDRVQLIDYGGIPGTRTDIDTLRNSCERQVCGWRQLGGGFQKDSQQTGSLR